MTAPQPPRMPEYLDLELEIGEGRGRQYPVAVVRSPAGEARDTMHFPFDRLALDGHLKTLELALLRSSTRSRRLGSADAQGVQAFGQALLDNLLTGPLRTSYEGSLMQAKQSGQRLRLRLRVQDPELAALPWEFLFDARQGEYLALSRGLSIVRYVELPSPVASLSITPPLRILAMASGPSDLASLDATNEKQRMAAAVSSLVEAGLVEVTWLESGTWRELQRAMRAGPWHIFHFIGHGGFSATADEGVLALVGDDGKAQFLSATDVGRLLADHPSLRLVVLNSCQGAEGSRTDLHSSTATSLVQRGIPAVIAMQYEITDDAAIEFSRTLYEALADELPVDAAVTEARIAVSVALRGSLEWGTPVLLMRATEGALFRLGAQRARRRRAVTGSIPVVRPAAADAAVAALSSAAPAAPTRDAAAIERPAPESAPAIPLTGAATPLGATADPSRVTRRPGTVLLVALAAGFAALVLGAAGLLIARSGRSSSVPRGAVPGIAASTMPSTTVSIASPAAAASIAPPTAPGTAHSPTAAPAATLAQVPCALEPSTRSVNSNVAATLTFSNQTAGPIDIYWLNYTGTRELYFTLPPGATAARTQPTYVNNAWLAADTAGNCLAIFEPVAGANTAVVTQRLAPPR
ncbi:MAG: CHAT domain-containing protein [Dehalococcoidia bacterium]